MGLARRRTIHRVRQGLPFVFNGDFMAAILAHDDGGVAQGIPRSLGMNLVDRVLILHAEVLG